jgi:membrane-associated phospholipid phosphatase
VKWFLLLLASVVPWSGLFAQEGYDFSRFKNETVEFIKTPLTWDGGDWLKLGVLAGGTFLVMRTVDQPVRNAVIRGGQQYFNSVPIEGGRIYGDFYTPAICLSGYAIYSAATGDQGARKIAYEIGQSALYAGAITLALKVAVGQARPYTNEGVASFRPFTFLTNEAYQSFPSGHTAMAFALSTVLSRNAGPAWLKVLAYAPALFTPVSRVYQNQHWVSSTLFGGILGYAVATWVVDRHEEGDSKVQLESIYPLKLRIALN